jgi:hypothetical protein
MPYKTMTFNTTLQSVVLTSSFASVVDVQHGWRPGFTYEPTMWNPITRSFAADPNLDLTQWPETWRPYVTYSASKKLAEKRLGSYMSRKNQVGILVWCCRLISEGLVCWGFEGRRI